MIGLLKIPTHDETVGALFIGFALSCAVFGILSQQTCELPSCALPPHPPTPPQ